MKVSNAHLAWSIVLFLAVALLAKTSLVMLSIPDVKFSYSTGECIGVTNYLESDTYTCSDLPEKYNHIWVK